MAAVTVVTAEKSLAIEAASVVDGTINESGHLILMTHGGTPIDAGPISDVRSRTAIVVSASDASSDWDAAAAYICDGVDDNVQLQLAITASIASGTPIVLSPGTFWVEAPLTAPSAVHIRGSGMDKTWLRAGDGLNDYVIKFTNATADGTISANISHLSIDGRCNAQTAGGGVLAMGAVECFFDYLHITNSYNWGLVLSGMAVGGAFGHNNRVQNCHFNASLVSAGFGGGVWMTSNDENDIRGCTFQYLGGTTAPVSTLPVAVLDQSGINNISGNTFVGAQPTTNAIHVRLHDTKLTKVIDNMFDGSGGHSIFATGTGHAISDNAITSPGDQGTSGTYSGIYLEYAARGCVVSGNTLETSTTAGKTHSLIRETADGNAGGNIITGNTLKQNGAGAPSQSMFDLSGSGSIVHSNIVNPGGTIYPAMGRSDVGIYVPPGWGQFWRPKRDAAGSAKATIAAVGSSSVWGLYSSNLLTAPFMSRLQTSLQTRYGNGGSGFFGSARSLVWMGASTTANAWAAISGNFASTTGTWGAGNNWGPGATYLTTTIVGDTITFIVRGTTARIYTMSGAGRSNWSYTVDGGSSVGVTDSGTGGSTIQITSITGLTNANHTIVITKAGAGGTSLAVAGVTGENATGVIMNNYGQSGATTSYFTDFTNAYGAGRWSGGPDYPADLVIYGAGSNDANQGFSADTYAANLRQFLSGVRDGSTVGGTGVNGTTDILILLQHIGKYDATNMKWQDYSAVARPIAEAYGAALVSMWPMGRNSWNYWNTLNRWGTSATAGGVAGTDSIHMSDAGHQAIADAILPILTN